MEETTISSKKHIITYGVIFGIIWVAYGLIRYFTNNLANSNWNLSIIELSIQFGMILYSIYIYKTRNHGFLRLAEGLKVGVGVALIGTILQVIWYVFLFSIIAPEIMDQLINLEGRPSTSELTIQNNSLSKESYFLLRTSILTFIGNLILVD